MPRTESQVLEALDTANQFRDSLAEIRAGLRQGKINLDEALSSPYAERMAIADLLTRIPKVGEVTMRSALKAIEVAEATHVGTLDSIQKSRLIEMFPPEKHQPFGRQSTTSRSQAVEALKHANKLRIYRAGLKKKLAAGKMTVQEFFDDPDCAGMKLREVLIKVPTRVGAKPENVRSIKLMDYILEETGLPGSKLLNQLTERQQKILLDRLDARYKKETGTYAYRSIPAA